MDLNQLWQSVLGEIGLQISRPNFITWLKNSQLIEKKDGVALVALPNNFAKNWVQTKYHKIILGALRSIDENTKKVDFIVNLNQNPSPALLDKETDLENNSQLIFPEFKLDPETNLNPRYTLNSFVVGSSNEMTYAAASAVIDDIGKKYNPLFIHGGVGLGKTHLIQAIGNEIKNRYKNKVKVRYVPSEKFINDVVAGVRSKNMEPVKSKYRGVDVLIIDDIQSIGGKKTTEEEFFNTFNTLYENSRQIIISSDRPPNFLPALHERLRSRFEGGMIARIEYPDYELRMAVLKTKLGERGVSLDEGVISLIANKIQKNLRELDGALNRILFYRQVKNVEVDEKMAEQIINETVKQSSHNVNPNLIIKKVADYFDIQPADIAGKCRKKEFVEPRQVAIYLLRDLLDLSYPYIGEKIGKRDHTTAMYAYEKVSREINKSHDFSQKVLMIKDTIDKESNS